MSNIGEEILAGALGIIALLACVAVIYTNSPIAPYINVDITISIDGSDYLATWENGTLAGNETVADTLFESLWNGTSNRKYLIETGVYNITSETGFWLWNSHNLTIWGEDGVIFREVKSTPTNATMLFSLQTGTNYYFRNIVFDQNVDDENVLARNDTVGMQWIGRVCYDTSVSFIECDFINGAQNGLVGAGDGVLLDTCTINNIGEHPIYTSDEANDWEIKDCTILNWGKVVRGYGLKLSNSTNVYAHRNIFDHDEDGEGAQNNVPVGGGGSYLFVLVNSETCIIDRNDCYSPHLPIEVEGSFYYDVTENIEDSGHLLTNNDVFTTHEYSYEG
jgi:hypothetical protein